MEVAEGMELIDRSAEPRRVADNYRELLYLFAMVPCQGCGSRATRRGFEDCQVQPPPPCCRLTSSLANNVGKCESPGAGSGRTTKRPPGTK